MTDMPLKDLRAIVFDPMLNEEEKIEELEMWIDKNTEAPRGLLGKAAWHPDYGQVIIASDTTYNDNQLVDVLMVDYDSPDGARQEMAFFDTLEITDVESH